MAIQERYHPLAVAADSTTPVKSQSIGGFLAVTSGTITITTAGGTVRLNAFPVTAGAYFPLPMYVGYDATVVLAGGASGTLLV